jgi:hypothetical protein
VFLTACICEYTYNYIHCIKVVDISDKKSGGKINELGKNSKSRKFTALYSYIDKFYKCYNPGTNVIKVEKDDLLVI